MAIDKKYVDQILKVSEKAALSLFLFELEKKTRLQQIKQLLTQCDQN